MNRLMILLKANIINTLNLNKLRKRSTGKISFLALLLVAFVVLLVFGSAFMYLLFFADMFSEQGMSGLILPLGLTAGSLVTFLTTLTTANGYLFRSNDFDMLMSLPVKPRTVFVSKLFYLLLLNYVTLLFLYFPTIVVYAIYNPTGWVFWVLALPVFLLFPLAIIVLGSLLSYLIGFATSRFRYKNSVSLLLTFSLVVIIILISFRSPALEENPGKFTEDINLLLNKIKIGALIYKSLMGNWLDLLLFASISLLPFIGFVYVVGRSYANASLRARGAYLRKNFKLQTLRSSNQNRVLLRRELKRYFSSNIYVMNTLIGPVLMTVFMIAMAFNMKPFLDEIPMEANAMEVVPFVLAGVFSFMLGLTSTTSSSLSIEGRQFWILRSAPVHEKQIFKVKISLNLLITVPFILLNVIIANFLIEIKIIDSLMMFIIPSLLALYMSFLGLFINILFPRFDYENETKIVKQSLSVLLTLLFGFLGSALILVPGFVVAFNTYNTLVAYLIQLGIEVLLVGIVAYLLYSSGMKKYRKIVF